MMMAPLLLMLLAAEGRESPSIVTAPVEPPVIVPLDMKKPVPVPPVVPLSWFFPVNVIWPAPFVVMDPPDIKTPVTLDALVVEDKPFITTWPPLAPMVAVCKEMP